MIPSVIAPPALYPGLYRPAALPLQHTLPSVFPTHSSFLVEDLLRISRPAAFLNRTVPSTSASLPTATNTVSFSGANAMTHEPCSPKTSLSSSKDPTFLKFGVSAILAPSPKTGEFTLQIHLFDTMKFIFFIIYCILFFLNLCFLQRTLHRPSSTLCTPRPSPSPALTETFTPSSGRLIYQVNKPF